MQLTQIEKDTILWLLNSEDAECDNLTKHAIEEGKPLPKIYLDHVQKIKSLITKFKNNNNEKTN